ncbi:unnamed protein product [Lymnaea stagnalis]|uniref:Aladin seven-bladed propeller domain-containing protein n=1 Tax=Lymnaea stagnalis TaxID=6523 RepID=A0AAV2IKV6_LYMST
MSSILLQFPPAPRRSHMTIFEQDGQMKDIPESVLGPVVTTPEYPEIFVQTESASHLNVRYESAQLAFLSHNQASWKRPLHAWYNGGLLNMFEELSQAKPEVPGWLSSTCKAALSVLELLKSLRVTLFSQPALSNEELLLKYSHVSDWHKSPVQAITWHPHVIKVAIALRDDSVHIYYSGTSLQPILKHKLQKQVTDLAWQPLSSSVLAVACQTCILIWNVEPTSLAVRPSASTVQILQYSSHSPVTSLSWSPFGDHLISACPKQASILVWDVPKETYVSLKRSGGGGISYLSYSPDGSKLFTASTSPIFRVWESKNWNWENWANLSGHCTTACWSPDSTVLIFAMEKEPSLFGVRFVESGRGNALSAVNTSVLLADVSQVSLSSGLSEDVRVGGQVKSIVWDETGERVAVMFQPNDLGNNHLVAVFKSTIHPVLELVPGGFVKGRSGESAHHIAFLPGFQNGALLSIVWSSGRVGYVPMFFLPAQQIQHYNTIGFGPFSSVLSPKDSMFRK